MAINVGLDLIIEYSGTPLLLDETGRRVLPQSVRDFDVVKGVSLKDDLPHMMDVNPEVAFFKATSLNPDRAHV